MHQNLQELRLLLELLYFLSGPALVAVAYFGLKQITVARQSAEMSARREAHRLATEQAQLYLQKIIPLTNKFDAEIKKSRSTYLANCKREIGPDKIVIHPASREEYDKHSKSSKHQLPVMNSLEAFSGFFISRVADEQVAFAIVGTTFCNTVEKLLPEFVFLGGNDKYFRSVLALFMVWHQRQKEWDLLVEKEKIDKALETAQPITIRPLGLEG